MKQWGIYLMIFGVGSFILPLIGLQFKLLSLFGEYQGIAGIICLIAGIVMFIKGRNS